MSNILEDFANILKKVISILIQMNKIIPQKKVT